MSKGQSKQYQKFNQIPPGWLKVADYAKRLGVTPMSIIVAMKKNYFPHEYIAVVHQGKMNQAAAVIDWNATIYDYITRKAQRFWPPDFEENEEREYKPIDVPPDFKTVVLSPAKIKKTGKEQNKTTGKFPEVPPSGGHVYQPIVDINSARYRHEQLKVQKLENELLQLTNETIHMRDVVAANKACAIEVRNALHGARRRLVPLLAGVRDARAIDKLLEEELNTALQSLVYMERDNVE